MGDYMYVVMDDEDYIIGVFTSEDKAREAAKEYYPHGYEIGEMCYYKVTVDKPMAKYDETEHDFVWFDNEYGNPRSFRQM